MLVGEWLNGTIFHRFEEGMIVGKNTHPPPKKKKLSNGGLFRLQDFATQLEAVRCPQEKIRRILMVSLMSCQLQTRLFL